MDKPKKTNPWIEHIKSFALKNGITYSCALSDPRCKETYKTGASMSPPQKSNVELTTQVRKDKILKKAPEKEPEKAPEKAPRQTPKGKNDNNQDLNITEYKGIKIKGELKKKLEYFVMDDSTLLKPLRKRIHISLVPTNRINREADLFFTNSISKSDILKDIKKYYDINLIKKYDIVPFDKLDITEKFAGDGITPSPYSGIERFGPRQKFKGI